MNRVMLLAVVLLGVVMAQTAQPSTGKADEELDKVLAGKTLSECQQHFHQCESDLVQLQTWAKKNYPIGQRLAAENDELRSELVSSNRDIQIRIAVVFVAVGFGMFLAWGTVKAIRRWWPSSKQRRQLITLPLMAMWVTVAVVVALSDSRLSFHPVNLAFSVLVYSLPALTFGGVGVWWFGRTKPEILW